MPGEERGRDDVQGRGHYPCTGRRLSEFRNYKSLEEGTVHPSRLEQNPPHPPPPQSWLLSSKGAGHPGEFSSTEQWCRCFVSFRPIETHHEEIASDSGASCDSTIQLRNPQKEWKSTVLNDQLHLKVQGGGWDAGGGAAFISKG